MAQLLTQGMAITRVENEALLRIAAERPRNEAKILKDALNELSLVPEQAAKAYYSIPYKETLPDRTVRTVMVEGPSIKEAMALARRWGNCTAGVRIMDEDPEGWNLEGVFLDAETNFRIARPFRQSKFYKARGRFVQAGADRQMMLFQAGVSKAVRNVILQGLPPYLVNAYYQKAKAIVGGKLDAPADQVALQGVLVSFGKLGIAQEVLERQLDKNAQEWTGSDIATLRGLFNAIQDGQVTIDEAFGGGEAEAPPDPQTKAQAGAEKAKETPPQPQTQGTPPKEKEAKPTDGASEFKIKQMHKILATHGIELKQLPENPTDAEAMAIINAGSKKTRTLEVLEQIKKVRETKK
jgi:hypothetical protein